MGPPGHLAIGFAAKSVVPKVPLWVLLFASWLLDILSIAFIAIGIEDTGISQTDLSQGVKIITPGSISWSHGLVMSILWSVAFGAFAFIFFRDRRTSIILGMVVFSHWILDFIVHLPDLPFFGEGSPKLGLGLWGSGPGLIASIILEFILLAGGIAIYLTARQRNKPHILDETK
jgi:hypothetical protein